MGLFALPFAVPGFVESRRSAEESVRSGADGARFRLGVFMLARGREPLLDGEVRLISSMPPVLDGDAVELGFEGLGVMSTWQTFLGWGFWTWIVSLSSPSLRVF